MFTTGDCVTHAVTASITFFPNVFSDKHTSAQQTTVGSGTCQDRLAAADAT